MPASGVGGAGRVWDEEEWHTELELALLDEEFEQDRRAEATRRSKRVGRGVLFVVGGAAVLLGFVPIALFAALGLGGPPPQPAPTPITNGFTGAGLSPMWVDALNRAAQAVQAIVPGCKIHASAIAAIAREESDFAVGVPAAANGDTGPPPILSSAGARGPMQFMPSTWAAYAQDGNGDGVRNIDNIYDATLGTAVMLCRQVPGSPMTSDADLSKAFFAYNHADWYVRQVLAYYHEYEAMGGPQTVVGAPSPAAAKTVQIAMTQLGKPYGFGACGPNAWDCSCLVQWAWGQAGVQIPRTTYAQWPALPHVDVNNLAPGDLVFFGTASDIHHVGMYVGGGQMIDAPHTGTFVRVEPIWRSELFGAARPGG